jgi:uncharacterized membrane protein YdbT with pleckstrin-like domain
MRYIEQVLQPGERLVHTSRIHWTIFVPGIVLLLLALALLVLAQRNATGSDTAVLLLKLGFLILAIPGAVWLLVAWFKRWTTEIDVTDRRVIYKRGFLRRHTVEMNMDKIESVDVDQSILGRILDYGDITIRGTGVSLETLPMIGSPLAFRNHVTAR